MSLPDPPFGSTRALAERLVDLVVPVRRCIFLSGLPGVGKSLVLQELVAAARRRGRRVHVLRWDVARLAFESDDVMRRYPEQDGVTHPLIRKAVGEWVRPAIAEWASQHSGPDELLIGEAPLFGNRLSEIAEVIDDPAEPLLAGVETCFVVPIPSRAVRETIERARAADIATPLHAQDRASAIPSLVSSHWSELAQLAVEMGLSPAPVPSYDPVTYADVYARLLAYRHHEEFEMDEILDVRGSAQDLGAPVPELEPSRLAARQALAVVEHRGGALRDVERWYEQWLAPTL